MSAICGGVVSETLFFSDPWAYMMAYRMPDKEFKQYQAAVKKGDKKEADRLFKKYAVSAI